MSTKLTLDEKIKNFLVEYLTQDNAETAFPIFHTIREKEKHLTEDGEGDFDYYNEYGSFLSREEAEEHLEAYRYNYNENAQVATRCSYRAYRTEAFLKNLIEKYGLTFGIFGASHAMRMAYRKENTIKGES